MVSFYGGWRLKENAAMFQTLPPLQEVPTSEAGTVLPHHCARNHHYLNDFCLILQVGFRDESEFVIWLSWLWVDVSHHSSDIVIRLDELSARRFFTGLESAGGIAMRRVTLPESSSSEPAKVPWQHHSLVAWHMVRAICMHPSQLLCLYDVYMHKYEVC